MHRESNISLRLFSIPSQRLEVIGVNLNLSTTSAVGRPGREGEPGFRMLL